MSIDAWWEGGEHVALTLGGEDRNVFVRRSGEGSPMTLLHGFPSSSHDWARVVPALAEQHALLLPDFLGFGASDKPADHDYSLHEQADLVEALWASDGVTSTVVVAHDYAVSVTQELLARRAEGRLAVDLVAVHLLNGGLYPDVHRPQPVQLALLDPEQGPQLSQAATEELFVAGLAPTFADDYDAAADSADIWRATSRDGGHLIGHRLIRYIVDRQTNEERWVGALETTDVPLAFVWGMLDPVSGAPHGRADPRAPAGGAVRGARRRGSLAAARGARAGRRIAAVSGPLRHVADLVRFAANRRARERDDAEALVELEGRTGELELAPGLEIEWLGVAGYRLTYEGVALLIDPYVSRVPLRNLLRRIPALPDEATIARLLPPGDRVAGILIGHTHFDHAVDAPALARRDGCPVLGSRSLAALMRLHGLGEQAVEVEPYRRYELGPFSATFVPSAHSKLTLGLKVPYDGELTCAHLDGLAPSAYRCGQVWGIHVEVGGTTLYHQGSADLVDDAIRHRGVDVFLAGVAGRSFTPDYWPRVLGRLEPDVVVAGHFDDFFRPLGAPMGFATNVDLAGFPDEVARVSRQISVAALPLSERIRAGAAASG